MGLGSCLTMTRAIVQIVYQCLMVVSSEIFAIDSARMAGDVRFANSTGGRRSRGRGGSVVRHLNEVTSNGTEGASQKRTSGVFSPKGSEAQAQSGRQCGAAAFGGSGCVDIGRIEPGSRRRSGAGAQGEAVANSV